MKKLNAMRAQVRGIGRSALVGTLVGLISAQAFASGLTETVNVSSQTKTVATSTTEPPSTIESTTGSSSSNVLDASLLPSAPEVAKVVPLAPLDPMVAEAAQSEQALASSHTSTNYKRIQRPGMLALGIAGIPLMVVGAYFYAYPTKATAAKAEFGSIFFVPGAAMSAIGFPLAFHKKK